ncbi:MAG: ABC transporter permease, partial [Thermoanaerobaculia bacterium]
NAGLIKKVLFPAEALPLVVVFSHLVHFILALPILFFAILIAALVPDAPHAPTVATAATSWAILLAPLIMLLQTIFVAGFALMVSSASVLFRDLRDIVANLLQLGFFLTPVLYLVDDVPRGLRMLLRLNPMTPFVSSYQRIFFFGTAPAALDVVLMLFYAALSLLAGFVVFERLRDTLAEAI